MRRAHTPPSKPPSNPSGKPPGSSPPPATSGGHHTDSDTDADLVAGDPPVPITVWRTPVGDDRASIPTRLAQRLVAAYSRPGEAVIDLTGDHALTGAAVAGARRHHPGWFTDAAAVIIGPPTPPEPAAPPTSGRVTAGAARGAGRRRPHGDVDPPELAAWFGDDLTDPDLPPHDDAAPPAGPDTVLGATSLVVACWPLSAVDATNAARLGWLLHACVRLLRPGGCLVLVVDTPLGAATRPEDFGPLVGAARGARLGYLQHIVAVRADVDGDQFVYYATDAELLTLAHGGERWAVAHLRVHADLLVFTPRQFPAVGGARG